MTPQKFFWIYTQRMEIQHLEKKSGELLSILVNQEQFKFLSYELTLSALPNQVTIWKIHILLLAQVGLGELNFHNLFTNMHDTPRLSKPWKTWNNAPRFCWMFSQKKRYHQLCSQHSLCEHLMVPSPTWVESPSFGSSWLLFWVFSYILPCFSLKAPTPWGQTSIF